jgi:EAL domain-containing protein (putative c-di-GMP-specific phosphodiesterase class I)/CheY-like chemotaxis protein
MGTIKEAPKATANRVLVIEDELPLLEVISTYLESELNCEVHCAVDREEAEALLDCYKYSLVITDLSLAPHKLDGLYIIEEVADIHGRPKIVVMSGSGMMKSAALGMGADVFIEKPSPLPELASTLRQLLGVKFCPSPKPPSTGRLLEQVLCEDGVVSVVQPIFKLDGDAREIVGVECLTRGPAGSPFQRPDALFSYARRKRAEHTLDQHCIAVALKAASVIPAPIRLALNVHASTLGRCGNFCDWLCSTAAENSIDPQRLTIEIVEHSPPWNKAEFLQSLANLRNAGIRIALDDVGLGHSNFQMMVDAKPDYFKLDRYFVHGCHRDKYRKAVVASVAKLAEELGGSVIAEGIEDPADLEILQNVGIELVQGFLFCRPVPVEQLRLREPQAFGDICACSLEPWTKASHCQFKGLGLCSRMYDGIADSLSRCNHLA